MKSFKIDKSREFLMKRMGDISQLAGTKRYELIDGKAKGIEAVDLKTGTGFNFTVPDYFHNYIDNPEHTLYNYSEPYY